MSKQLNSSSFYSLQIRLYTYSLIFCVCFFFFFNVDFILQRFLSFLLTLKRRPVARSLVGSDRRRLQVDCLKKIISSIYFTRRTSIHYYKCFEEKEITTTKTRNSNTEINDVFSFFETTL